MSKKEPYSTLAFVLFRKCTASCEMCCFECNPYCTEHLDIERVKEYIDEAADIDCIKQIAFTGGEPFLEYETLVELVKYVNKRGMKATVITNGYWANTYEIAYKKLKELRDAGLSQFNVSHDHFHKKYIKTENVVNVLKAASCLGISSSVGMVLKKGEKIGDIIDDMGSATYGPRFEFAPCLSVGGASKNLSKDSFDRQIDSHTEGMRCLYSGNLVVSYDNYIYPCCSQVIMDTGLNLGDFRKVSLKDALYSVKNNSLLYLLRNRDMSIFVNYVEEKLDLKAPEKVVHQCELCSFLFKREMLKNYKDLVDSEF